MTPTTPPSETKVCGRCGETKPTSDFNLCSSRGDGLGWQCRICNIANLRDRRRIDPVGVWAVKAYNGAKGRAIKCGLVFHLTAKLLKSIAPTECPVLGIPLDYTGVGGRGGARNAPTVDRIIPALGYIPENIIVVSMRANAVKSDASPEEILRVGAFYDRLISQSKDWK
jgi:ribosomal protein L40E